MTLFLEQYLDNLQMLPGDLQRKLRLLRELDQKSQKEFETGDTLTNAFVANLPNLSKEERKKCYEDINSHYGKAKALGDEKVQLAMQTYEMVDKHIRRLDAELARFEGELKRNMARQSTERDAQATNSGAESADHEPGTSRKKQKADEKDASKAPKKRKKGDETGPDKSAPSTSTKISPNSLAQNAASTSKTGFITSLASMGADVMDMPIDPNEPVYCVCRQVSYGEMIGCDNPDCPIEWFHFNCVGLTTKPKGKWFCPRCAEEKKKAPKN